MRTSDTMIKGLCWAKIVMASLLLLMMSCKTTRNMQHETVRMKDTDSTICIRTTAVSWEELTRKVSEREDLHIVWYDTTKSVMPETGRPPVAAEAWISHDRDEEEMKTREDTVVTAEDDSYASHEEEWQKDKETRKSNGVRWMDSLMALLILVSGILIMIYLLRRQQKK